MIGRFCIVNIRVDKTSIFASAERRATKVKDSYMSRLEALFATFKSAPKKIKTLLRRQGWKEVFNLFSFVLLSLGFWMLQSLQQDYEIEHHTGQI